MTDDPTATVGPFRWSRRSGPLEITLSYAWIEGRMECVRMIVSVIENAKPLEARDLRSIPLARLADRHRPQFTVGMRTSDSDGTPLEYVLDYRSRPGKRGGRPPIYGPEHFAAVARVYREAFSEKRLTPTRAVGRRFGVSPNAAAKWVARCRELGLLPKTTKGKARIVEPSRRRRKR